MLKVYLTVDPATQRGLYDNEAKFMGVFQSMADAAKELGDMLRFCSIRSA